MTAATASNTRSCCCGGGVRRRGFLQYRRSDHETELVNMSTWFIGLRHGAKVQIIFIVVILIFIDYGIGIGDVHPTEFRWKTSCFVWSGCIRRNSSPRCKIASIQFH